MSRVFLSNIDTKLLYIGRGSDASKKAVFNVRSDVKSTLCKNETVQHVSRLHHIYHHSPSIFVVGERQFFLISVYKNWAII